MERLSSWFFNDSFWLPEGITFGDLQDKPGFVYAKPRDLIYVPLFSIGIYALRVVFERFAALPFARKYALSDGSERKSPRQNEKLESYYKMKTSPSEKEITGLAKQLDWTSLSVERWFRRKRNWYRPSIQTKFCETSWRCLFYTFVFAYGMGTLWQSSWLWDNYQCWVGFPQQTLHHTTYTYYMLEASFYLSLLFTVMGDVKRKDFREQLIHHVATVFLILFSYVANFVRIGTLVMVIHDVSDVLLEGAKCMHYLNYKNAAEATFVVFAVTFLVTRLIILPFWVLHTSYFKTIEVLGPFPSLYCFNALLVVLQCLHIFWGSIILKMAYTMLVKGEEQKDDRSDVEETSTDDNEPQHAKQNGNFG